MAKRKPVAILCDEVSRYWVSDFILPHVVLGRKYGGEIKLFTQSTQQMPPDALDILLSSCGHLVSFTIGSRDAQRIVQDLAAPMDEHMVKDAAGWDWLGAYGDMRYWSISEQTQHMISLLMNQEQRQMLWRVRTRRGLQVYLAETTPVSDVAISEDEERAFREESARIHGGKDV